MSEQVAAYSPGNGDLMEQVIVAGDLSRLSAQERTEYYANVCHSVGLNPLTQPFAYIKLSGRLTLYARKDATDQLRKINGVSISKPSITYQDDLIIVSVEARDKTGRTDADVGVVHLGKLTGEARANAIMKAVTKSKRRVTLSICGLGFLDETEIETIPDAEPFVEEVETAAAANTEPEGGITVAQVNAIHDFGSALYGRDEWKQRHEALMRYTSGERTAEVAHLTAHEAEKLIKWMAGKLDEMEEAA